jgi:hypothetical protein
MGGGGGRTGTDENSSLRTRDKRIEIFRKRRPWYRRQAVSALYDVLSDIVLITLIEVMAKVDEWGDIAEFARLKEGWLRKFLALPNGIPSHDTRFSG